MKLIDNIMKRVKTFNTCDFVVFKTYCAIFGMMLGAYLSVFVKQYIWIFLGVFVILMIYLLNKMFGK